MSESLLLDAVKAKEELVRLLTSGEAIFNPSGRDWSAVPRLHDLDLSEKYAVGQEEIFHTESLPQFTLDALRDDLPVLPAESLVEALREVETASHPNGLALEGVRFAGELDLRGLKIDCALSFRDCYFGGLVDLSESSLRALTISRSLAVAPLHMRQLRVSSFLFFEQLEVRSEVVLFGADLNHVKFRNVDFGTEELESPSPVTKDPSALPGLYMRNALVRDHMEIHDSRFAKLNLAGAKLQSTFRGRGIHIEDDIVLDGAVVDGDLVIETLYATTFQARNLVVMGNARVLRASIMPRHMPLTKRPILSPRISRVGGVDLTGSSISGKLVFDDMKTPTLILDRSTSGELSVVSARIWGCAAETPYRDQPTGLSLRSATVLTTASLAGAQIADSVVATRSTIIDRLDLTNITVGGRVDLSQTTLGDVDATAAKIGEVQAVEEPAYVLSRLDLSWAEIAGDATLQFELVEGAILAKGMQVKGQLLIGDRSSGQMPLDLSHAVINILALPHAYQAAIPNPRGQADETDEGQQARESFPRARDFFSRLGKTGHRFEAKNCLDAASISTTRNFRVMTLDGFPLDNDKAITSWLSSAEKSAGGAFWAQPWLEIADALHRAGHDATARNLRYQATDRQKRQRPGFWGPAARHVTRATIGHGYRPWLVVPWLIGLWVVAVGLGLAFPQEFTPTDPAVAVSQANKSEGAQGPGGLVTAEYTPVPLGYTAFFQPLFAVDTILPAIQTGQASSWHVTDNAWLIAALAVVKALAWVLLGLFVTGFTGVFKARS